jgi:hypothetical protein
MKYYQSYLVLGLIILLVCIVGCTSSAPPTTKTTQLTPTPKAYCDAILTSGKYNSVQGMSFNTLGTPDNYATVEINGNTGVLTLQDGIVINMLITPTNTDSFCAGTYKWTGSLGGNGELGVVGANSSKIIIYGIKYGSMNVNDQRTYTGELDFVKI